MNNTFSLQQISRTGNLDSILISRQYKLNLMADFMRIKYGNPKLKQSEIANQLGYSSYTLKRYRNDIDMLSPYENKPKNNPHRELDVKRPRKTSKNHKMTANEPVENKNSKLKGCANIGVNEQYLDVILHDINS